MGSSTSSLTGTSTPAPSRKHRELPNASFAPTRCLEQLKPFVPILDANLLLKIPTSRRTRPTEDPFKRKNFPLPFELREQVYCYLVGGALYDPKDLGNLRHSTRKYQFSTGIFSVNHAVNKEATAVMRRENVIISIKHQTHELHPLLQTLTPILATGIIRTKSLQQFFSMEVLLSRPHTITRAHTSREQDVFFILLRDLPRLVTALQMLLTEDSLYRNFPLLVRQFDHGRGHADRSSNTPLMTCKFMETWVWAVLWQSELVYYCLRLFVLRKHEDRYLALLALHGSSSLARKSHTCV